MVCVTRSATRGCLSHDGPKDVRSSSRSAAAKVRPSRPEASGRVPCIRNVMNSSAPSGFLKNTRLKPVLPNTEQDGIFVRQPYGAQRPVKEYMARLPERHSASRAGHLIAERNKTPVHIGDARRNRNLFIEACRADVPAAMPRLSETARSTPKRRAPYPYNGSRSTGSNRRAPLPSRPGSSRNRRYPSGPFRHNEPEL